MRFLHTVTVYAVHMGDILCLCLCDIVRWFWLGLVWVGLLYLALPWFANTVYMDYGTGYETGHGIGYPDKVR